jgi:hypothetical protein
MNAVTKIGCLVLSLSVLGCGRERVELPAPESTSVGTPVSGGTVASAMIGAAGGSLSSGDGRLAVNIPAGALAANAMISITPISNTAHSGIGAAYRLAGVETFQQPVTLTFSYVDADLKGTAAEALDVAFQTEEGFWQVAPSKAVVDPIAKTVQVTTTHFSDWSLYSQLRLVPASATLKVNQARVFEVHLCVAWVDGRASMDRSDKTFACRAVQAWFAARSVSDWTVDGIRGGNATVGTIFDDVEKGGYAAPSKKPSPDTVTVKAKVSHWSDPGRVYFPSAEVTITEEDPKHVLDVSATYAMQGQLLTTFVKGNVVDDGVKFQLQFPITGDETPPFVNQRGGDVSGLMETRVGCINPTSSGVWDELNVSSVVLSGNFVTLSGSKSTSAITLGVGEGDCAVDTRVEPAKTTSSGVMITLPTQLFTSTTPPATPISVTQDGWTLTFTTVR